VSGQVAFQRIVTTGAEVDASLGATSAFTSPGWFPAVFWQPNRVAYEAGSHETLVATTGQYNPNESAQPQRIYTGMSFGLYYHDASTDWLSPTISSVDSALGGRAHVTVTASDASGIQAVVVAYVDVDEAGEGAWFSESLSQSGGQWAGDFPAAEGTQFMVQAVDGVGNARVDDNGGRYYSLVFPLDPLPHKTRLPLVRQ